MDENLNKKENIDARNFVQDVLGSKVCDILDIVSAYNDKTGNLFDEISEYVDEKTYIKLCLAHLAATAQALEINIGIIPLDMNGKPLNLEELNNEE